MVESHRTNNYAERFHSRAHYEEKKTKPSVGEGLLVTREMQSSEDTHAKTILDECRLPPAPSDQADETFTRQSKKDFEE